MGQQVAMVIEVSLWLPWGPSYHSNKILRHMPIVSGNLGTKYKFGMT